MAAFLGQVPLLLGRGGGGGGGRGGAGGGGGRGGFGSSSFGGFPYPWYAPNLICPPGETLGADGFCYPAVPANTILLGRAHGSPLAVHPQPGSEPWCAPDEYVGEDYQCHKRPKGMPTSPLFQGYF